MPTSGEPAAHRLAKQVRRLVQDAHGEPVPAAPGQAVEPSRDHRLDRRPVTRGPWPAAALLNGAVLNGSS